MRNINTNIYDASEAKDVKLFKEFRSTATSGTTFWSEAMPTNKFDFYDVVGVSSNDTLTYTELKYREAKTDEKYPTSFIEAEKYRHNMQCYYNCNILPLYVNFVGGTDNVYLWFLPDVDVNNLRPMWVKCRNVDGTEKYDLRFQLDWADAWHWVNGELVNKPDRTHKKKTKKLYDIYEGSLEEYVSSGQYKLIKCNQYDDGPFINQI